jgi:hypothetical protein
MKVAAVLVALCALGCTGSLNGAKVPQPAPTGIEAATLQLVAPASGRCVSLDERHALWSANAQGAGLAAGAAGISALPVEDKGGKIGLAIGALAAGIWATVSASLSSSAAESWARECAR